MPKFMQIIDVARDGLETLYHPETDADYVLSGSTYKVPRIVDIEYWMERGKEIEAARKGEANLKSKIDKIDIALLPNSLLEAIKKVDGAGSGLDADTVDGRTVDDSKETTSEIWTAFKVKTEVGKKLNSNEVVTEASPNRILRLNSQGSLDASITKNAATATRFFNPVIINFIGDTNGSMILNGNEKTISVDLQVSDDSHGHTRLVSNQQPAFVSSNNLQKIIEFKKGDLIKSFIDSDGIYQGDVKSVNNMSVDNTADYNSLWTSDKLLSTFAKAEDVPTMVKDELNNYSTVSESTATVGPLTISKVEVEIGGESSITLELLVGKKIISESYIVNSNSQISFVRVPGTNTLVFNEVPELGATLTCSVIGV